METKVINSEKDLKYELPVSLPTTGVPPTAAKTEAVSSSEPPLPINSASTLEETPISKSSQVGNAVNTMPLNNAIVVEMTKNVENTPTPSHEKETKVQGNKVHLQQSLTSNEMSENSTKLNNDITDIENNNEDGKNMKYSTRNEMEKQEQQSIFNNEQLIDLPSSQKAPVVQTTILKPEMDAKDKSQKAEKVAVAERDTKEELLAKSLNSVKQLDTNVSMEREPNELLGLPESQTDNNKHSSKLPDSPNDSVEAPVEPKSDVDTADKLKQTEKVGIATKENIKEPAVDNLSNSKHIESISSKESGQEEILSVATLQNSSITSEKNLKDTLNQNIKLSIESPNGRNAPAEESIETKSKQESTENLNQAGKIAVATKDVEDEVAVESLSNAKHVETIISNEFKKEELVIIDESQKNTLDSEVLDENNLGHINSDNIKMPVRKQLSDLNQDILRNANQDNPNNEQSGSKTVENVGNERNKSETAHEEKSSKILENNLPKMNPIEENHSNIIPNSPLSVDLASNEELTNNEEQLGELENSQVQPEMVEELHDNLQEPSNTFTEKIQSTPNEDADSEIIQNYIPHDNDHTPSNVVSSDIPYTYNLDDNTLKTDDLSSPEVYNNIPEQTSQQISSSEALDNVDAETTASSMKTEKQTTNSIVAPLQSYDTDASLKDGTDGLFSTILGTVNEFISSNKKSVNHKDAYEEDHGVHRYSDGKMYKNSYEDIDYCNRVQTETCYKFPFGLNTFLENFVVRALDHVELIMCIIVTAASTLFFIFGYYCFCNKSNENTLVSKLNLIERSFLAKIKENSVLINELTNTRSKLASIEDNSFGSNEMVASLMKELENEHVEKKTLQDQVKHLEKELVLAADAGLELNTYVSELLTNQHGEESIKVTVEELQRQLNEQDQTIRDINASLAEKSRENSELQLSLSEQNARLTNDLSIIQQENNELEIEKANLQSHIEEFKSEFSKNLKKALESKNYEIQGLQNHNVEITSKCEQQYSELQTSSAKIEALEDCLKTLKKDSKINIDELITTAKLKGELTAMQKKYTVLKGRLNSEVESKRVTENQLRSIIDEIEKLKKEYNQSEKDKLDAQTRLEVLSSYFKEKEAQLQKELNIKEAMWLKQQGENTGTVDKITGLQEEIQILKSQNDELRAEIEAQVASHKAQTGILQNRLHEHYLSARQAERRYDESRNEAAILRSHLTAMAANNNSATAANSDQMSNASGNETQTKADLKDVPSPIPGSPFFPPPLPFLPPQGFLTSPQFMGLPPPPSFLPPPENMRPAPLGRIKSPTSRSDRYSPMRRSRRFSPHHDEEYSDYDDDDYYDDIYENERISRRTRRRRSWQRGTYSPPPTNYSFSPSESRYNCIDTETDISPPESPLSNRASPIRPNTEV